GRLQGADDEILWAQRGRVVGCLHVGPEFGVTDTQRQAVRLHGFEMRPAHHAGYLVPGQRQPHRKMTANGARAENAYAHWNVVPVMGISGWTTSFHMLASRCNHAVCNTGPAETDRSTV